MAMVVARWRREGDGGGSEGDGGGGLGNDGGGNNDGRVGEGDGGGGLGEGSVGEGEGGAGDGGGFERTIPERVPSPQHRDFRDQHDEPRRFCAGAAFPAAFARAPPAVKWISCAARRHCQPRAAEEKNELCS